MANNWPDTGATSLSKTEKWLVGLAGVALVAAGLGYLAMRVIAALMPDPSPGLRIGVGLVALGLALAWVQPWNQEPPAPPAPRPRRRRTF